MYCLISARSTKATSIAGDVGCGQNQHVVPRSKTIDLCEQRVHDTNRVTRFPDAVDFRAADK